MLKFKKIISLLLLVCFVFVGCSSGDEGNTNTTDNTTGTDSTDVGTDTEDKDTEDNDTEDNDTDVAEDTEKIFRRASTRTSNTANIHQANTGPDFEITDVMLGTLYMRGLAEDGITEVILDNLATGDPVDVNGDGLTWEITIDENAKWQDGTPINADTFIYSYKMVLDPVLLNGNAGNFSTYYVKTKNAVEYYTQVSSGVEVPWEDVGIKKVDDMTIQIELSETASVSAVKSHFTLRYTGVVHEGLYEANMNSDRSATQYGTSVETLMSAGPFALDHWTKGAERRLVKNENYVHADRVNFDQIVQRIVEDAGTQTQMYESGELDFIQLSSDGVAQYEQDPRRVTVASKVVRHIDFNIDNPDHPILDNLNFRKALYYGVDRETVGELTSLRPASYYVSHVSVAYADGTLFREIPEANAYLPENFGYDPELAKEYFDKALQEEGLTSVELDLNYTETIGATKVMSEFLQSSYTALFGEDKFKLNLNALPNAQHLDTMKSHQTNSSSYEMAWSGWGLSAAEYLPHRAFQVLTTSYGRKNAPYRNERFDEVYAQTELPENKADEAKMAELTMQLEQIYIEDAMGVPVVEDVVNYMVSENLVLPNGEIKSMTHYIGPFGDLYE